MGDIWPLVNGFVGAIIGGLGLGLSSYFRKKGENLATKEDIAAITHKVERVRLEYAESLEQLKQKGQLSLAAIDKRLETHQEAYALWWKLPAVAHKRGGERKVYILKCENWWAKNCLYLDAEARQAFRLAYHAAYDHVEYLDSREADLSKENWEKILAAGDAIVKGAELPSWGEDEYKLIESKQEQ